MFSTISGFYVSCFFLSTNPFVHCPAPNLQHESLDKSPHLGSQAGQWEPFHWFVTIFLFSLVLCANLKLFCPFHGPYIMFDSCTVIAYASLSSWIAVCDAELPIKLYESQFDKGMYMSTVPLNNKFDISESSMTLFDSG